MIGGYELLVYARAQLMKVCESKTAKPMAKIKAAQALLRSAECELGNDGWSGQEVPIVNMSSREYLEAVRAEVDEKLAEIDREAAN